MPKTLQQKDGIWYAANSKILSYPDSGNELCFQLEDNSFWFRHRNNCIIQCVKLFAPNDIFFDVGGGNGYVSSGLEKHNIETVLIEPGIQGATNAKKRKLPNIICATLEDSDLPYNSIPTIGLFDVVEHIEDDAAFMQTIHTYLRAKGKVLITVPAYKMLWSAEDNFAKHYRRYTVKSMKRLLTDCNFKIIYSTYIFSILPLAVLLFRSIPYRIGMGSKSDSKEKHQNDHSLDKGKDSFLQKIWSWELKKIRNQRKIPFGGSCLVIAEKV